MTNQNLFLPICVPLLTLFILITVIAGMRSRLRFAKRLFNGYSDNKKMENWNKTKNQVKQRIFMLVILISILGILLLSLLITTGAIAISMFSMIIYATLIVSCLLSGVILLIDLEKFAK